MDYRRVWQAGGCYFFTVVTYQRKPLLTQKVILAYLRQAIHHIRQKRPFTIDAMVVLPDHLHCIWQLPENDSDYATRWRLIKHYVSRKVSINNIISKPVWQKRYWEHYLRDEQDWRNHMDYIHYNPVKHGYVKRLEDWPFSSYQYYLKTKGKEWLQDCWQRYPVIDFLSGDHFDLTR